MSKHFLTCYQTVTANFLHEMQLPFDFFARNFKISSTFGHIKLEDVYRLPQGLYSSDFPVFIECFVKHHTITSYRPKAM